MTDAYDIRDNPAQSRFEAVIEGHLAKAEYRLDPGVITFTHTEVPKELGGRGLGGALVRAGLASARARGLKVAPQCPFFAKYFQDHPEARDILHPDWFAKLGVEA